MRSRRIYAVLLLALVANLGALASVRDGTATPASWAHWAEAVGVVAASWMAVTAAVRASVDLSRPSRWLAWLTPYSLNIYFIHYLLCVFMHVLLLPLSWSPLFKAAATFMVVLPTSIGLARSPRVAVGALVALQVGLLLYT